MKKLVELDPLRLWPRATILILSLLLMLTGTKAAALPTEGVKNWISSWTTSPQGPGGPELNRQTIRQIIHLSAGGSAVRVRLTNLYGKLPIVIGAGHIAIRIRGDQIDPESDRVLTVQGKASFTIPAGEEILTDNLPLKSNDFDDLAISLYLPEPTQIETLHWGAQQTSYLSAPGEDRTGAVSLGPSTEFTAWYLLSAVDVLGQKTTGTIVAFGDSITDGACAPIDSNRRWPNDLAERVLRDLDKTHRSRFAVVDAGISGNRLLHPGADPLHPFATGPAGVDRFNQDVLRQTGVKSVIVLIGINDLGHPGSAAPLSEAVSVRQLIAGLKRLVRLAHRRRVKIFAGTLTPFEGTLIPHYESPQKELKREALNRWIRKTRSFDGIFDFDRSLRDPRHPQRLLKKYDGGDHLHPNVEGCKAIANTVILSIL